MRFDDINLAPYSGKEPFVFLSYSHKDKSDAEKIIRKLNANSYRVWYDEGITAGKEWTSNIAERIEQCGCFFSLISHNSNEPIQCKKELLYAIQKAKPVLPIYLENIELPSDLAFQLIAIRAVYKENYSSNEDNFYKNIFTADGLDACKQSEVNIEDDYLCACKLLDIAESSKRPKDFHRAKQGFEKTIRYKDSKSKAEYCQRWIRNNQTRKIFICSSCAVILCLATVLICQGVRTNPPVETTGGILPSAAVETQSTEVLDSDNTAEESGQTENTTGTAEDTDEKTGHAAICITELPLGEKPGEADLNSIGSVIKYPDDKDYLDEYRYAVVSAPSGHSIYSFGSAAHDGTPQTLLNNEEVLILAEHKGYSCVIVLSQKKARWVNTEYLTINEKCLILREKPCAEDLNTVDPGVSHPDTNEFLDAYEQKHVKTNQDLSGISCMRILAEGEKEGNYFKVEDGTEIVVLARNRYEFSCVLIPSMNAAGWIESRYLA